jgi:hypothetical protein|tara:strand:- start:2086 stop:2340 length:255 start_codon:yes stop_codon:yes gene_type:complete
MNISNDNLEETVETDSDLKGVIVDYIGNKLNPETGEVTVENVVDIMAHEFPEFLLAVAEENWVRGYEQGLYDQTHLTTNEDNDA